MQLLSRRRKLTKLDCDVCTLLLTDRVLNLINLLFDQEISPNIYFKTYDQVFQTLSRAFFENLSMLFKFKDRIKGSVVCFYYNAAQAVLSAIVTFRVRF